MQRVEDELGFSRGVIRDGHELVPRYLIGSEDGEVTIFVQLPDDMSERNKRMELVATYMKVKMATWFVMSSELAEPDACVSCYVDRDNVVAGLQIIDRTPLSFGEIVWLPRDQIGDELPAMLPAKEEMASAKDLAEVEELIRYNEGLELRK